MKGIVRGGEIMGECLLGWALIAVHSDGAWRPIGPEGSIEKGFVHSSHNGLDVSSCARRPRLWRTWWCWRPMVKLGCASPAMLLRLGLAGQQPGPTT